jgi:hypothetical protein
MPTTRRFFLQLSTSSGLALACGSSLAQAPAPVLSEADPQAQALGYVTDAKRVDKSKYPKYAPGQHCAACQLYQGPPTAPMAPCAVFGGKQVAGPGWCSAYVPRQAS